MSTKEKLVELQAEIQAEYERNVPVEVRAMFVFEETIKTIMDDFVNGPINHEDICVLSADEWQAIADAAFACANGLKRLIGRKILIGEDCYEKIWDDLVEQGYVKE